MAEDVIVARFAVDGVIFVATFEAIVAITANDGVFADPFSEAVTAIAAANRVVVVATIEAIVARVALQRVEPGTAGDGVVTSFAVDDVIAAIAVDAVATSSTENRIVQRAAIDGIDSVAALDGDQRSGAETLQRQDSGEAGSRNPNQIEFGATGIGGQEDGGDIGRVRITGHCLSREDKVVDAINIDDDHSRRATIGCDRDHLAGVRSDFEKQRSCGNGGRVRIRVRRNRNCRGQKPIFQTLHPSEASARAARTRFVE